ncbi:MAG: methylisocitrate lyase [Planctomycetaceae bacterium]|nr:methylisocitrate lyase [Planctomycetaceae bacterium]
MSELARSPGQKFRDAFATGTIAIPGVFNALTARLAERAGFQAVYQSGASLSAGLAAVPDIGLLTATEFVTQGRYLTQAVSIPVISDADTGFGEPLAVERTVQQYEAAGLAGLHLEDQENPKRCGHLNGKTLVPTEVMVAKILAAVAARKDPSFVIIARTDARGVDGFDAAVDRSRAYLAAGADMIFPEALETADEFALFSKTVKAPLLANMTEFGKSPLLSLADLAEMGYAAALFPVTLFRVAMQAVETALTQLAAEGTQRNFVDSMQTRKRLYELLDYSDYDRRDQQYSAEAQR